MTDLGKRLEPIRQAELRAGNSISEEADSGFENCEHFVRLKLPFHANYKVPGVRRFENRDSHYPVGVGYKDDEASAIITAPFTR